MASMPSNLPDRLAHIQAKVIRGGEHFKTLQAEMAAFLNSYPCELVTEFNPKDRAYIVRAKPVKQVPLRIRVIAGEILGQLRSSLDHLAWQLALLQTQTPGKTTQFPIFRYSKDYARDRGRYIGDLSDPAKTIIDGLQPHVSAEPERSILWTLNALANADKHRLPNITYIAPSGFWFGADPPRGLSGLAMSGASMRGRKMAVQFAIGGFDSEKEIGRVEFLDPAETDLEIDRLTVQLTLAFADAPAQQLILLPSGIPRIAAEVKRIVDLFVPFF